MKTSNIIRQNISTFQFIHLALQTIASEIKVLKSLHQAGHEIYDSNIITEPWPPTCMQNKLKSFILYPGIQVESTKEMPLIPIQEECAVSYTVTNTTIH